MSPLTGVELGRHLDRFRGAAMSSQTKSCYVLLAALLLMVGLIWLLIFRQNDNVASPAVEDKAITSAIANPVTAKPAGGYVAR